MRKKENRFKVYAGALEESSRDDITLQECCPVCGGSKRQYQAFVAD